MSKKAKKPAKGRTKAPTAGPLTATLLRAIRESDQSLYAVAKGAGVGKQVLLRFASGERDVRLATADLLAAYLGLGLAKIEETKYTSRESSNGPSSCRL